MTFSAFDSSAHLTIHSPQPTSEMEARLLNSTRPIQVNREAVEEIIYNGTRGVLLNRDEIRNWKPPQLLSTSPHLPISKYPINTDNSPRLISKPTDMTVEYTQEFFIRYLRPTTPPDQPGDIVIQEMANQMPLPAPPIIIRQQPPRPETPEPIIIREQPPPPPPTLGRKLITISSHTLRPPPPRKVIIERLPALPPKPRVVLVERWLPYDKQKRRVIFQRPPQVEPEVKKPKNLIIQWEPPRVEVRKKVTYLGIVRANPADYTKKFENNLTGANNIPEEILNVPNPNGLVLAAESQDALVPELYGDVNALIDIDLEREGLMEYRSQIHELNASHVREYLSPNSPSSSSPHQQVHHIVTAQSPLTFPLSPSQTIHRIVRRS